jgi:DNA polymerase-3 subunit delta'
MDLFGDEPLSENTFDETLSVSVNSEGLQVPQASSFFIGHDHVERDFLDLWNNNKMPHAFILNGIKGIGKATFAYRLARFILKESSQDSSGLFANDDTKAQTLSISDDDSVFHKVASGGHPDIRVVTRPFDDRKGRLKTIIGRDELRVIPTFFSQKSAMGGWQVVIIDDANMMSKDSQNVVLKILEEPPKKSIILLVTHGVGGLIPTIRSRCRFVSFDPLSDDIMHDILNKAIDRPIMPDDMDFILSLANGSAGQAIESLENNDIETLKGYLEILKILTQTNWIGRLLRSQKRARMMLSIISYIYYNGGLTARFIWQSKVCKNYKLEILYYKVLKIILWKAF